MSDLTKGAECSTQGQRLVNWDLLRTLAMFSVVVVHCGGYLGQIGPVNMGLVAGRAAIACDPVFFALSGYFALRPLKRGLRDYYQKKLVGIVVPLVVYSALLYLWSSRLTELSIGGYFAFAAGEIGSPWWFIPTLIPFLVLAPFLCQFFEALSDKWALRLCKLVLVASLWSCLSYFGQWLFVAIGKPGAASMIETITYLIPTHLVSVGYFVFFCAGYFLRRMMPLLSKKNKKQLIAIGFLFWALDVTALYVGVSAADPSDYWFWVVIALFIIFDRVEIGSTTALGRAMRWTGERSYTIYLLQYTSIKAVAAVLYDGGGSALGVVSAMPWLGRLGVWVLLVFASYALSLLLASVFDALVLKPVQRGCRWALRRISSC